MLVDRLWPRGVSKKAAKIDVWMKELAPSSKLRSWFHEDPEERYKEFVSKYKKELAIRKQTAKESLGLLQRRKAITLVTAAKDIQHSHIPTLTAFLKGLR